MGVSPGWDWMGNPLLPPVKTGWDTTPIVTGWEWDPLGMDGTRAGYSKGSMPLAVSHRRTFLLFPIFNYFFTFALCLSESLLILVESTI